MKNIMKHLIKAGVCLGFAASLFAQVNAVIGGTVADASGAVIPRVQVTAKNVDTGIVTTRTTNDTGTYEFPACSLASIR